MNSALHADSQAMEQAWERINSEDAIVRSTAREHIESQPVEKWLDRALLERRSWAALEAIRVVCNKLPVKDAGKVKPHLCEMITTLPLEQMSEAQLREAITVTLLIFEKLGDPTEDERRQMVDLWEHIADGKDVQEKARASIVVLLKWLKQ